MARDSADRLRGFVHQSLGNPVGDDDDIFQVGGATSLFAMELVLFIEESLGVALEDSDLKRENFSTVSAMLRLLGRKAGAS
jgi:methoxymalonate biosynthesis acyl carrier protein